jgi:hypothetical protein
MNTADVLELLVDRYAAVPAPAPSAALAARMDSGWIGSADDDRGGVVVPFVARPRVRVRYLAAALVATFVAMSSLAVAGALPDPIQRGVSSIVSHLGIDLPNPHGSSGSTPGDGNSGGHRSTPSGSTPGGAPTGSSPAGGSGSGSSTPGGSSTSSTTTTVAGNPGGLGDLGVPTTLPPTTLPPPLDTPPLTLPPITVPQLTLPPVTLPPITVGPITIQLPPLQLPGL